MNMLKWILASVALSTCAPASAEDGDWLARKIASAGRGAVIEIPPGTYDVTDLEISRSITLKGPAEGEAVLRSAEVTEKGLLVPLAGVNLRVENITFAGARSWDRNGAGIRHEGRDLTVVNCRFLSNEDGILATGDPRGVITIVNSEFRDSGFGDGQSHGIYVAEGAKLEIDDSAFAGTRIGHHVKSLAGATSVADSAFDDAHGRSSYAIDASRGGTLTVTGNTFIQAADADNHAIVNYDLTRGGEAAGLVLTGNRIENWYDGGVFLRNDTKLAPTMSGNEVIDRGRRPIRLTAPG